MFKILATALIPLCVAWSGSASAQTPSAWQAERVVGTGVDGKDIVVRTYYSNPPTRRCDAKNGNGCTVDLRVSAEPGFVACRRFGAELTGRGAYWGYMREHFLPNDPQTPPRFRTYRFIGYAKSQTGIGGYGSDVGIVGFGMEAISINATAKDRFDNRCDLGG